MCSPITPKRKGCDLVMECLLLAFSSAFGAGWAGTLSTVHTCLSPSIRNTALSVLVASYERRCTQARVRSIDMHCQTYSAEKEFQKSSRIREIPGCYGQRWC